MEKAKVHLSADELKLLGNSDWILTKNRVIEKIITGLGEITIRMREEINNRSHALDDVIAQSSPKISRGEKYQGLPYVILDYPKIFQKENILAIRTFFWWGNFCSITLHVKGRFHEPVLKSIRDNIPILSKNGFYLSVMGNEWNHDLTSADYCSLTDKAIGDEFYNTGFLKLSAKVEFSQWNDMENKLFELFLQLLKLLER